MTPSVVFSEHPAGRHRTHMRNTMQGWIEEREPDGFLLVTLEDGFHYLIPGDELMLNDKEFLFERARVARDAYLQMAPA